MFSSCQLPLVFSRADPFTTAVAAQRLALRCAFPRGGAERSSRAWWSRFGCRERRCRSRSRRRPRQVAALRLVFERGAFTLNPAAPSPRRQASAPLSLTVAASLPTILAMIAMEMPLLRHALANAFGIVLLIAVCGWLLHRAIRRSLQLWRRRTLALAFEQSQDPALLLRRTLQTLAETPGIRIVRKTSR